MGGYCEVDLIPLIFLTPQVTFVNPKSQILTPEQNDHHNVSLQKPLNPTMSLSIYGQTEGQGQI